MPPSWRWPDVWAVGVADGVAYPLLLTHLDMQTITEEVSRWARALDAGVSHAPSFLQLPNRQSWKKCYTTWISVTFWCLEGTWIQDKSAWSSTTVSSTSDTWMPLILQLATPSMVRSHIAPLLSDVLSDIWVWWQLGVGWSCSPRGQVEILTFLNFTF